MDLDRQKEIALRHCSLPEVYPHSEIGATGIYTVSCRTKLNMVPLILIYNPSFSFKRVALYWGPDTQWIECGLTFDWK